MPRKRHGRRRRPVIYKDPLNSKALRRALARMAAEIEAEKAEALQQGQSGPRIKPGNTEKTSSSFGFVQNERST